MVFGWLFGEKKQKGTAVPEPDALMAQADEATRAKDVLRGEALCRDLVRTSPDNAEAWTMLGVNLIRRDVADPEVRAEAVVAWMRALALKSGDSRAGDHLRVEIQYPDELVSPLVRRLEESSPAGDAAAGALGQIGEKARPAVEVAAGGQGPAAERARTLLATMR
jgi:hypothetical protein